MKIVFKEKVESEATFGSLNVKDVFRIAGSECLYMKLNWESAFCIDAGEFETDRENCIFRFGEEVKITPVEAELIVYKKKAGD